MQSCASREFATFALVKSAFLNFCCFFELSIKVCAIYSLQAQLLAATASSCEFDEWRKHRRAFRCSLHSTNFVETKPAVRALSKQTNSKANCATRSCKLRLLVCRMFGRRTNPTTPFNFHGNKRGSAERVSLFADRSSSKLMRFRFSWVQMQISPNFWHKIRCTFARRAIKSA